MAITTIFSTLLSPVLALTLSTDNKNISSKIKSAKWKVDGYQPYLEVGGAKYFNQISSAAGIYDLFIPLWQQYAEQLIFTDLRIFDRNGSAFEGNIHLGYRKLYSDTKQMFGIYGAVDRKRSDGGNNFKQITLGVEYWQNNWFFGGNGYKPIGQTKQAVKTENEKLIIAKQISRTIATTKYHEKSLSGLDAELGYAFADNFTGYAGGYYFHADDVNPIAGSKVRFAYNYHQSYGRVFGILDRINVELGAQYDKPHGCSAYIGIKLKVGLTNFEKSSDILGFERHMVELVDRDPDIVIAKAKPERIVLANMPGDMVWLGEAENPEVLKELLLEFGLPENATWQEVRDKWRGDALKYHPDKNRDNSTGTEWLYYSQRYKKIASEFRGIEVQNRSQARSPHQPSKPMDVDPHITTTAEAIIKHENKSFQNIRAVENISAIKIFDSKPGLEIFRKSGQPVTSITSVTYGRSIFFSAASSVENNKLIAITAPLRWADYLVNQIFKMLVPIRSVNAIGSDASFKLDGEVKLSTANPDCSVNIIAKGDCDASGVCKDNGYYVGEDFEQEYKKLVAEYRHEFSPYMANILNMHSRLKDTLLKKSEQRYVYAKVNKKTLIDIAGLAYWVERNLNIAPYLKNIGLEKDYTPSFIPVPHVGYRIPDGTPGGSIISYLDDSAVKYAWKVGAHLSDNAPNIRGADDPHFAYKDTEVAGYKIGFEPKLLSEAIEITKPDWHNPIELRNNSENKNKPMYDISSHNCIDFNLCVLKTYQNRCGIIYFWRWKDMVA